MAATERRIDVAPAQEYQPECPILIPVANTPETAALWHRWFNDPDIRIYMLDGLPSTMEEVRARLEKVTSDTTRHYYDIMHDGVPVGLISLVQDQYPATSGEIGILIGEKHLQENGLGTRALAHLLDMAKHELGMETLRANIKPENVRSRKLFAHAGFTDTGIVTIDGTPMRRYEREFAAPLPRHQVVFLKTPPRYDFSRPAPAALPPAA